MAAAPILPGDVITMPYGMRREIDLVVVHSVHLYENGAASIRYRYLSNPRGIDWSGYVAPFDPDVRVVSRGVCRVDHNTRSMLP